MRKKLTENQIAVLYLMGRRDSFLASMCRSMWEDGKPFDIDDRARGCIKGFVKMFNQGNMEAVRNEQNET